MVAGSCWDLSNGRLHHVVGVTEMVTAAISTTGVMTVVATDPHAAGRSQGPHNLRTLCGSAGRTRTDAYVRQAMAA